MSSNPFLSNRGTENNDNDDSFDIERFPELTTETGFTPMKKSLKSFYHNQLLPNLGLVLVASSQFFNSLMVLTTKLLETDPDFEEPIHPLQILFVRMIITVLGCYLYLKYVMKEKELLGPINLRWLLLLRGVTGFVGVFAMYYSLMFLSLSDAVVITFLIPSMTGFLAWVLLREKWTLMEASGALVSLVGVVLIARPPWLFGERANDGTPGNNGVETSDPEERVKATFMALFGVVGASSVYIVIRFIGKRVHSLVMVEYFSGLTVLISLGGIILIPGLSFKIPQTGRQWFLFFTLGISGFCMQFLLTEGIQRERAGRATMMLYTQMIYAIFWEIVIWNHLPNLWSWLGIVIILGSAFTVLYYKPKEVKQAEVVEDTENTYVVPISEEDNQVLDETLGLEEMDSSMEENT